MPAPAKKNRGNVPAKQKPKQKKGGTRQARSRSEKVVQLPTKSEDVTPAPIGKDHTAAAIGGSNARELIQKVADFAASLGDAPEQSQATQVSRPPRAAKASDKKRASSRVATKSFSTTVMYWLRKKIGYLVFVVLCGSFLSAAPIQNTSSENSLDRIQAGQWVVASMYWQDKLTSTGKAFKPVGLHAAHKTLPIGTLIRVSNPKNHRSINITINDRGPYIPGRDLDLTLGAGALLGFEGLGTLYMEVLALPPFENVKRPLVENLFAANDANTNVICPNGDKCAFKTTAAREAKLPKR
jgi:rare lipoprotein A (peptidoglycan hydrolase)